MHFSIFVRPKKVENITYHPGTKIVLHSVMASFLKITYECPVQSAYKRITITIYYTNAARIIKSYNHKKIHQIHYSIHSFLTALKICNVVETKLLFFMLHWH